MTGFKKRAVGNKGGEIYILESRRRPVMAMWSFTGKHHPRGMDDPQDGTKDIRSGGGVMTEPEDLTDDGDIQCVRQLI